MGRIRHLAALAWSMAGVANAQTQAPSAPVPMRAPVLGINLSGLSYYANTAPFANLAIGSEWSDAHWRHLSEDRQDKDGNLLSVPDEGGASRFLLVPPTGPAGIDVRCTFTGAGSLGFSGFNTPLKPGPHSLSFHLARGHEPLYPWIGVQGFDPRNPMRDIDCRDVRLPRTARFRPEALAPLRGFKVIRFMDWQNANANGAVTWATRKAPGALRVDRDGIAIEDMLALTLELGADPWFVMPWNADDDYIRRFAGLVRDTLPAGRQVYVELSNEVWNNAFSASQQATREGLARGLSTNPREANIRRYAQRTVEVMRIWEAAYAGHQGLVRVIATQEVDPGMGEAALSWGDTARHVDALSTAAYFGDTVGGTGSTRESGLAVMTNDLPRQLAAIQASRRIAAAHGKRFIAYEGGPSLSLPAQIPLLDRIQHDPALYGITKQLLDGWAGSGGDLMCLYYSIGGAGTSGMWGLASWEDDTPAEAPKLRAAHDFIAAHPSPAARLATPIAR